MDGVLDFSSLRRWTLSDDARNLVTDYGVAPCQPWGDLLSLWLEGMVAGRHRLWRMQRNSTTLTRSTSTSIILTAVVSFTLGAFAHALLPHLSRPAKNDVDAMREDQV